MNSKAPASSFCLHTETRVSFEPSTPIVVVQLQLPSTSAFSRHSRGLRKVLEALPLCRSEEEYKSRNVACSSAVYFRTRKRYPRSILWRCLEDNRLLEIRSLDLSKDEDEPREANVILRLGFPSPICNNGIAIADSEEDDFISIFAISTNNELYTISLRTSFLCKPSASEDDFERWIKIFRPSSLSISSFFRLVASAPRELLIALTDGRLLRLTRRRGEDGSLWDEAAYNDGQWASSLRGLIRWPGGSNNITFEGNTLDHNTALGASVTPDHNHMVSVGLNHTIKFWNIQSGRPTISRDLLDVERGQPDSTNIILNPSTSKVLEVFECQSASDGDLYYAMTYSSHSPGTFKIWAIRDADNAEFGIRDLFSDDDLRAPEPDDGAIWTVSDFKVRTDHKEAGLDIWIMMRLNRRYKLYHRQITELRSMGNEWQYGWTVTAIDPARNEPLNEPPLKFSDLESVTIGDRWLAYLTAPGRYPVSVLETALRVYIDGRQMSHPKNSNASLKERISTTIGSRVFLQQADSGSESSVIFYDQLNAEWTSFWNTIMEIEQVRWEPLSLGFDNHSDIAYVLFGDGCSVIREFSELETWAYNKPQDLIRNESLSLVQSIEMEGMSSTTRSPDELATILDAAARFRSEFSSALKTSSHQVLQCELWLDSSLSAPERLQAFYDQCDFESEVRDSVFNSIEAQLKPLGGFKALTTDVFGSLLTPLANEMSGPSGLSSTIFGLKVSGKGLQDLVALHSRVLADLVYLLVFLHVEMERERTPIENLDASEIFLELLEYLRRTQMTRWLADHTRAASLSGTPLRRNENNASESDPIVHPTLVENLFVRDIKPQAYATQSQSLAVTQTLRDILIWVSGGNEISLDKVLVNIQCNLLKYDNIDLASSFVQFQPSTAWATYVRGRLCLAKQEYNEAAHYFKKAAYRLSLPVPPSKDYSVASSGLLDTLTASFLASGFPNYYQHIIDLYSPHRAHVQIISFAQLALQHYHPKDPLQQRSELLSRLFHAALAISDHTTAYSALTRYTDTALQKAALASLITSMVSSDQIDEFLSLPFPTLKNEVEAILAERARAEVAVAPSSKAAAVPYFKILYSFHLRNSDFRAAAAVLVSRLEARHERRNSSSASNRPFGGKREAERSLDEYLVGINALALLEGDEDDNYAEDEAWVFVEESIGSGRDTKKRRVMRLDGLRERYQAEMDRVGAIEMGRWGIIGDDDDEMDGVENNGASGSSREVIRLSI